MYKVISGTYNLQANLEWSQLQRQEIRLLCDTSSEPCTINLFEIADIERLWNAKIYITDISNNAGANNITIVAGPGDTIDAAGNTQIVIAQNGVSALFAIVRETQWAAFESNAGTPAPLPSTLSYGLYAQTIDLPPIEDTIVETTLIGTGQGTLSVGANQFKPGDSFRAKMGGRMSISNNNTIEFNVYSDGALVLASGIVTLGGSTDKDWSLDFDFTVRKIGAAGVGELHTNGTFTTEKDAGQTFEGAKFHNSNNTTFDTTILNTLNITAKWGAASANNSIYSDLFILNKVF
jgi:hypothetical protein